MTNWTTLREFDTACFTVRTSCRPDDMANDDNVWEFRVTVWMGGLPMATEYLCDSQWKNPRDFLRDGYHYQMVRDAAAQARHTLQDAPPVRMNRKGF